MENQPKFEASDDSVAALLDINLIRMKLPHRSKAELVQFLVRDVCSTLSLADPQGILKAMLAREKEGIATTLDTGLSLPHARVDGLARTAAILGFPAEPISEPKQPNSAIRAMFLFLSPNQTEAFPHQLKLLRSIARLFKKDFLDELVRTINPEQALRLIQQREASLKNT